VSELPGVLGVIAEVVGPEGALAVGQRLAGASHKFPTLSTLERLERDLRIRREFNGRNLAELCERYGLSRRQLYRIIFGPDSRK
jgi:Mor family transcriptional regulator